MSEYQVILRVLKPVARLAGKIILNRLPQGNIPHFIERSEQNPNYRCGANVVSYQIAFGERTSSIVYIGTILTREAALERAASNSEVRERLRRLPEGQKVIWRDDHCNGKPGFLRFEEGTAVVPQKLRAKVSSQLTM